MFIRTNHLKISVFQAVIRSRVRKVVWVFSRSFRRPTFPWPSCWSWWHATSLIFFDFPSANPPHCCKGYGACRCDRRPKQVSHFARIEWWWPYYVSRWRSQSYHGTGTVYHDYKLEVPHETNAGEWNDTMIHLHVISYHDTDKLAKMSAIWGLSEGSDDFPLKEHVIRYRKLHPRRNSFLPEVWFHSTVAWLQPNWVYYVRFFHYIRSDKSPGVVCDAIVLCTFQANVYI